MALLQLPHPVPAGGCLGRFQSLLLQIVLQCLVYMFLSCFATAFLELIPESEISVSKHKYICKCVRYSQVPFLGSYNILYSYQQYMKQLVFLDNIVDNRLCCQASGFYQTDSCTGF